MVHRIEASYPDNPASIDLLHCGSCGSHLWERGTPVAIFVPCVYTLLFTDCEAEVESWCEEGPLAFARQVLAEDLTGPDAALVEREGHAAGPCGDQRAGDSRRAARHVTG